MNEVLIMSIGVKRKRDHDLYNTRLIMWEIRTKYLKKGRSIKPEDIFPIGDQTKKPKKQLTAEEYEQLKKAWPCPTEN